MDLFLHNVEVVEEPFRCGRDLALLPDRLGDVSVRGQKRLGVVADPREKIPSFGGFFGGALCLGQAFGVLLQALDAEELGADRFFPLDWSDSSSFSGTLVDISNNLIFQYTNVAPYDECDYDESPRARTPIRYLPEEIQDDAVDRQES